MAKSSGRAKLFEKYDEHVEKDYDPEADHIAASGSEESDDENAGTEHYVSVGKSKLRAKGEGGAALGPQYRGSKVSRRHALEAESSSEEDEDGDGDEDGEEYDDPETADLEADTAAAASDSEISSDDALGESDGERLSKFVFRGSSRPRRLGKGKGGRVKAADYLSASGEDEVEDEDEDEDEDDESLENGLGGLIDDEAEEDDDNDDEDEDEDEDDEESGEDEDDDDEDDIDDNRRDKGENSQSKPAIIKKSPNADIEKGIAIQKQRKIYDGLLNLRIRLQKALIAANTFSELQDDSEQNATTTESYDTAEAAAVNLLETIGSLRSICTAPVAAGTKRKRDLAELSSAQIWEQFEEEERRAAKLREKCLDKWSRKVQSINLTAAAPKGLGSRGKTLVESLQDQLNDPEKRLVKRTRVPRSCAPAQAGRKVTDDEDVFDDTDFYQLLLKDLVAQRTVDSWGDEQTTGAVPTVVMAASREGRARKVVDRKASKGRKMRFTVHEKLQSFMAPEDRRSWEQSAIDRFFGTLFGRKLELNEDEADEEEETDGVVADDFKLFA